MDHAEDPAGLLKSASEARSRAYCPYSGYAVGAAILASSGKVFTGCNVENASYSVTTCAERVALQAAVCAGEREFAAIAVVAGGDRPPRPCGSCLQVLAEFSPGIRLLLAATGGRIEERVLSDLLPEPFRLAGAGGMLGARGTPGAGTTSGAGGMLGAHSVPGAGTTSGAGGQP